MRVGAHQYDCHDINNSPLHNMPALAFELSSNVLSVPVPVSIGSALYSKEGFGSQSMAEVALKLVVNCFSTGANILNGKVFDGRMIDVRLSNVKLFHRASDIVAKVAGCPLSTAIAHILQVLHAPETPPPYDPAKVPEYVTRAAGLRRVVPTAVLICTGKYTLEAAKAALESTPNGLWHLVSDAVKSRGLV